MAATANELGKDQACQDGARLPNDWLQHVSSGQCRAIRPVKQAQPQRTMHGRTVSEATTPVITCGLWTLQGNQTSPAGTTPAPQQPQQDPSRNLKLPQEDLKVIKERVFGLDNFYVRSFTNTEAGATFMGNVRGTDPAVAYQKARQRLQVIHVLGLHFGQRGICHREGGGGGGFSSVGQPTITMA